MSAVFLSVSIVTIWHSLHSLLRVIENIPLVRVSLQDPAMIRRVTNIGEEGGRPIFGLFGESNPVVPLEKSLQPISKLLGVDIVAALLNASSRHFASPRAAKLLQTFGMTVDEVRNDSCSPSNSVALNSPHTHA